LHIEKKQSPRGIKRWQKAFKPLLLNKKSERVGGRENLKKKALSDRGILSLEDHEIGPFQKGSRVEGQGSFEKKLIRRAVGEKRPAKKKA